MASSNVTRTLNPRALRSAKSETDTLADRLASGLKISNAATNGTGPRVASKGKGREKPVESPEERKNSAMRSVNANSQSLSSVIQSGWKASMPRTGSGYTVASVSALASTLHNSLNSLRKLSPGDLDVERAASSVVGKLIALEMYEQGLEVLKDMHKPLVSLCHPEESNTSSSPGKRPLKSQPVAYLPLLSLPLPPPSAPLDMMHQSIICTYLSHALTTISRYISPQSTLHTSFLDLISRPGALLSWIPHLTTLPSKTIDSTLKRNYVAITTSFTSPPAAPLTLLTVRFYALRCLVLTSDLDANTFWEQTIKVGSAYIKTVESSQNEEAKATRCLLDNFRDVVRDAESRQDKISVLQGRGWISFCEYWLCLAKRASDYDLLNRIATYIQSSASSSTLDLTKGVDAVGGDEDTTQASRVKAEDRALQAAKLCATFAQTIALFQRFSTDDGAPDTNELLKCVEESKSSLRQCRHIFSVSTVVAATELKVRRALEKLRRASVKMLDQSSATRDTMNAVRGLVESIVDVLKHAVQTIEVPKEMKADLIVSTLDSLFKLAATVISPTDAETWSRAYDYLSSSQRLVESTTPNGVDNPSSSQEAEANYIRCISGAFYNLAGVLYKAGVYAPAVRFLKDACPLGEKALQLHEGHLNHIDFSKGMTRPLSGEEQDKDKESWTQLRAQLYKRWELLGVCYSKIGDRKLAYESLVEGIKKYPFRDILEGPIETSPLSDVFSTTDHQQVASMIDRATYIGAAELFLKRRTSLLSPLRDAGLSAICIGSVLERQIRGLDGSRWKPAIREVVQGLLDDLLAVYGSEYPVRRAKALIRWLEHAYLSEVVSLHPDEVGEDVQSLLSSEDLGQDRSLSSFRSQYLASCHLWLALHAHRRDGPHDGKVIIHHANEAYNVLRSMVTSAPEPTPKKSPSRGSAATAKRKKPTSKVITATPREKAVRSVKKAAVPGTSVCVTSPQLSTLLAHKDFTMDDFEGFMALLRMGTQLLGLLGQIILKIQLLNVIRRLSAKHGGIHCEAHIRASIDLAHELVKLGKTEQADSIYGDTLTAIRGHSHTSDWTAVLFFLRYAESLVMLGNVSKSSAIYEEALSLSEALLSENKAATTSGRIRERVALLEQTALAAIVHAAIQYTMDDPAIALTSLLKALRLLNRATDSLTRLNPIISVPKNEPSNPFDIASLQETLPSDNRPSQPSPQKNYYQKTAMDGLEWRIADGLFNTLFALSQAYFTRGSAREAEYFAQQAEMLAETLCVPAMVSRALVRKSEIQLHLGHLEDVDSNLVKANTLLKEMPGTDAAEVRRLKGDHCYRHRQDTDARGMYVEATAMLGELETVFDTLDNSFISFPRKSHSTSLWSPQPLKHKDSFAPLILASILRQQIWLLRNDAGEEYGKLLDRFLALPQSLEIQSEANALLGKLALHDIHERFRADMFLSSLAESTIALPMGMSGDKPLVQLPPTHDILAALSHAEELFRLGLETFAKRGRVTHVREAAVSLALVRAFQTALGKPGKLGPVTAAGLLDMASSITLRREMLEAIQHKFPSIQRREDMVWDSISTTNLPVSIPKTRKTQRLDDSADLDDEELSADDDIMKRYWTFLREKYKSQTDYVSCLQESNMGIIPNNWVVVSISATDDKSTLVVSRQRSNREPLIFCVPLRGRRDSDDDEHLTFEDALTELKDVILASDGGTRRAADIKPDDKEGKLAWWAERKQLDQRLKELLENIEFCWLGAFKTILSQPTRIPPDVIPALRVRFEKVFKNILGTQEKKLKSRLRLDDGLLECFAALSPTCRDEELEDLVYFVLDLYHFHGVPIALAEVDVDQVAVDLRMALEEHHAKVRGRVVPEHDSHVFLVLDKNVQGVPWESIPVLRGQSLVRCKRGLPFYTSGKDVMDLTEKVDRAQVDPSSAYYVLNPSGDLPGTEGRFSGWVKEMGQVGWEGIIGHQPSEQQLLSALEKKDLVIYFGHGGAEQYIRSHKIRHLPRCAATMLWGCSSGALREMGDFDRIGTPYNYMLAGCPALVANIWDVTDRDIDKFSLAVFHKLRLEPSEVRKWKEGLKGAGEGSTSLMAAVAQARESCKLKYLTGAAPVVYGIPFYL